MVFGLKLKYLYVEEITKGQGHSYNFFPYLFEGHPKERRQKNKIAYDVNYGRWLALSDKNIFLAIVPF